jgi:hypothetical protein
MNIHPETKPHFSIDPVQSPRQKVELYLRDSNQNIVTYIGPTSAASCPLIYNSPRYQDGFLNVPIPFNRNTLISLPPDIHQLAFPPETISKLIDHYFTFIHPKIPIIDKQTFSAKLFQEQDSSYTFLLYSVLLLTISALSSFEAIGIRDVDNATVSLSKKVRFLSMNLVDRPDIQTVQAMLLLTLSGLSRTEDFEPWTFLGIAVRQAQMVYSLLTLTSAGYA